MTRSLLRPIRTRRIVRSSTPLRSQTNRANSITPRTRKTLAAIGALWVSFAVSASVNTASAKPVMSAQETLAAPTSSSAAQVSPGGDHVALELQANGNLSLTEKDESDYRGSVLAATPPISGRHSKSEAQRIVFITTGKRAAASVPPAPKPEIRLLPADASTALAYLKSISK
jgi:hypothetical protein